VNRIGVAPRRACALALLAISSLAAQAGLAAAQPVDESLQPVGAEPAAQASAPEWQEPAWQEPAWQEPAWEEPIWEEPAVEEPVPQEDPNLAEPAPAAGELPSLGVASVEWISERRVRVMIDSAAMGAPVQTQLLLARDWHAQPDRAFPAVYLLDGMRARDDESGWTLETDAESWFSDKNVNVVLPIGGQSSFYADWLQPDNGFNYQWETFLTRELPPILEREWRSTSTRGVVGLSMGGTAAMTLAARNTGFFDFAASLSGILSTTSAGMPSAIRVAMLDAGGFDANAMWGEPGSDQWRAHDPFLLAENLRGISLYVASGTGTTGAWDEPDSNFAVLPGDRAGLGLEVLARITSQAFANKLGALGIPVREVYRPNGTHSWPYWELELHELWPQLAEALGIVEQ
jgi:S-formylglutathione hydrolase FrmB